MASNIKVQRKTMRKKKVTVRNKGRGNATVAMAKRP